ncbi:MAG: hypothetical protein M0R74_03915 [Dehalococcoidia bacterium]|nr:hypothetical protein [Dehalococcoidia bacterium]
MTNSALFVPADDARQPPRERYCGPAGVLRSDFPFLDLHRAETGSEALLDVVQVPAPLPVQGREVRALWDPERNQHTLRVFEDETGLTWDVPGVGQFHADAAGQVVRYFLEPDALESDAENMLVGPVLSVAGQLAGHVMLHASAIEFEDAALAFSAPSGWGKSTLVASFRDDGLPLMSDDVLPLQFDGDTTFAVPYLPKLKLWAASLRGLGAREAAFTPVLSWRDKRRVKVEAGWGELAHDPRPLRILYLLAPHPDPNQPIAFEQVETTKCWAAVHSCMYMAEMLHGARAVAALDGAARIAASLPVRVVRYHRSFDNLPAIREAILRDAAEVTT